MTVAIVKLHEHDLGISLWRSLICRRLALRATSGLVHNFKLAIFNISFQLELVGPLSASATSALQAPGPLILSLSLSLSLGRTRRHVPLRAGDLPRNTSFAVTGGVLSFIMTEPSCEDRYRPIGMASLVLTHESMCYEALPGGMDVMITTRSTA